MSKKIKNKASRSIQPSFLSRVLNRLKSKKYFKRILFVLITFGLWAFIMLGATYLYFSKDLPDLTEFANNDRKPKITIRNQDGIVLAKYGDLYGNPLTYSQLPQTLVEAIVATEDQRFFSHFGFDIFGIMRAYLANLRAGRYVQGGSTITQQLAKVVYLTPEKTIIRKIQEVLISMQLEKKFSKEQLLTLYLNRIYLGRGNYGVDAAARYYFGKTCEELDLFESAILAGMIKAPSRYSPANNPELSFKRARFVLSRMYDEGFITKEEMRSAIPPTIIDRGIARGALKNPYFSDYILSEVSDLIDNPSQDLNVYTSIDLEAQDALEKAAAKIMIDSEKVDASEVAGIIMEPNGAIKAMIGGKGYNSSQFNRAVTSIRQPGSTFKMFVYLAALEKGYEPSDIFTDQEISYSQGPGLPVWTPRNFKPGFAGDMTMESAFARSINTVAVQVSETVGRTNVINMARRLGVKSNIPNYPSMALGASDITLLEMTQAFAHLANNGLHTKAFGVTLITDAEDNVLYEYHGAPYEKVLSTEVTSKMKGMLASVVESGTGRNAALPYRNAYGKTGTSQDFKDAWFIGFTDDLVGGIWIGNDNNKPMKKVVGGTLPAKVWKEFMMTVGDVKPTEFIYDESAGRANLFDFIFNKENHELEEISEPTSKNLDEEANGNKNIIDGNLESDNSIEVEESFEDINHKHNQEEDEGSEQSLF